MQEVSGGSRLAADFGEESSSDEEDEEDASAEPDLATGGPKPADISINAELGELALFVSGRTPDSWWPPQVPLPASPPRPSPSLWMAIPLPSGVIALHVPCPLMVLCSVWITAARV